MRALHAHAAGVSRSHADRPCISPKSQAIYLSAFAYQPRPLVRIQTTISAAIFWPQTPRQRHIRPKV